MNATDISSYIFWADLYHPECILEVLTSTQEYNGWALAPGAPPEPVEDQLNEIAATFGVDRTDETSFDSGDFPKVVFAYEIQRGEVCGGCGGFLDEDDIDACTRLTDDTATSCRPYSGWSGQ